METLPGKKKVTMKVMNSYEKRMRITVKVRNSYASGMDLRAVGSFCFLRPHFCMIVVDLLDSSQLVVAKGHVEIGGKIRWLLVQYKGNVEQLQKMCSCLLSRKTNAKHIRRQRRGRIKS